MGKEIPVNLDDSFSPADLHDLHNNFADTPEGQNLAGRIRYGPYKPDHVSSKEWVGLLGADVDNLEHGPSTLVMADAFLRHSPQDQFNSQDQDVLRLAAMIHDWGEGIPGHEDIITRYKTAADYQAEHDAMLDFLDRQFGEMDPELVDELKYVYTNVVSDRESRLGRAFNAIERMGHIRTATRAWGMSRKVEDPHLQNAFRWMSVDVASFHVSKLLEYREEFDAVEEFLGEKQREIESIFDRAVPSIFYNYEKGEERDRMRGLFRDAKDAWKNEFPDEDEESSRTTIWDFVDADTLSRAGVNYGEHSAVISDPDTRTRGYVFVAESSYFGRPDDNNILVVIEQRPDDEVGEPEFYLNRFSGRPRGDTRAEEETAEYDQKALVETLHPDKKLTGDELTDYFEPWSPLPRRTS